MLYDRDIREPLFDFLEENYGKVRIIEEKQIGKSRADVMLVLDSMLAGVEIKSDADTYARLERQIADYNRCFDINYIAVGSTHAAHVTEHVPEWWGIITVEEKTIDSDDESKKEVDFYILRQPELNPRRHHEFFRKRQIDFLWRPELANIQERYGLHKYKNKSKLYVRNYIMDSIPEETLKKEITDELFERDYAIWEKQGK